MTNNIDGWNGWGRHVLEELKRLSKANEDLSKDVSEISELLASLRTEVKIKTRNVGIIYGSGAGGLSVIIYLLAKYLMGQ
jgi:hypothetical protein